MTYLIPLIDTGDLKISNLPSQALHTGICLEITASSNQVRNANRDLVADLSRWQG
jgi:hypothetical protein